MHKGTPLFSHYTKYLAKQHFIYFRCCCHRIINPKINKTLLHKKYFSVKRNNSHSIILNTLLSKHLQKHSDIHQTTHLVVEPVDKSIGSFVVGKETALLYYLPIILMASITLNWDHNFQWKSYSVGRIYCQFKETANSVTSFSNKMCIERLLNVLKVDRK